MIKVQEHLGNRFDFTGQRQRERQREDENYRREKYKTALDLIMELAVELPTYQRQDLFGYDQNKIDVSTFYTPAKPFKGLTSNLTSMSLIEK